MDSALLQEGAGEYIPVPWRLEGTCWPRTAEASPFFDLPVGHGNSGSRGQFHTVELSHSSKQEHKKVTDNSKQR